MWHLKVIITTLFCFFLFGCIPNHSHNKIKNIYINQIEGPAFFKEKVFSHLVNIEFHLRKRVFFKKGSYPITIIFGGTAEESEKVEGKGDSLLGVAIINDFECKIIMDDKTHWSEDYFKLVLYHEIGHCLGLDHPESDYGSVMDAGLDEETREAELADIPIFLNIMDKITINSNSEMVIGTESLIYYPLFFVQRLNPNSGVFFHYTYPFYY